jgi:molybdopterin/thiamine biosynthesis adenylyltransferase
MIEPRYDRNVRFFGSDGQDKLQHTTVAIPGVGGLGTHVVQQLALLGVGALYLIDPEELDESNRNRYVGARWDDPVPGTPKVSIGERLAKSIRSDIAVETVAAPFNSEMGYAALKEADFILGCLDTEGCRLMLLEMCAVLQKPYIDLASDILPEEPLNYGGRVCFSFIGHGCLSCRDLIDRDDAGRELAGDVERANRTAIYGVDKELLTSAGPSVAPINGVVASLGVTEFMLHVTGVRTAKPHLNYNGRTGKVTVGTDPPMADCYYCQGLFAGKLQSEVKRYFRPTPASDPK